MAGAGRESRLRGGDLAPKAVKVEEESLHDGPATNGVRDGTTTPDDENMNSPPINRTTLKKSDSESSIKKENMTLTPNSEPDELINGDTIVTEEHSKAPKSSRKQSQKVATRPAPLFDHLPDATEEASTHFQVIKDCIYGSKYMGHSDLDSLDCDCTENWRDGANHACGEDSDCMNRLTKMECVDGNCNCGNGCQNQRFQRKSWANVSVIKTERKGYGLRVNTDLHPGEFIFEYIGEVINEPVFRRRTMQYDDEGIKHFYFMSLTKSEFVDATKKGNMGRFCNHSCNPNCYVDKWVVGEKLRMGIFAERHIKAGEELVFNYNVDRYGADPQPCYCDEPNCTGYIGGKTQTERATKLSHATIEALGIEDGDGWDTAVAKRPRKKKTGEDDEEYVNNVQPKGLDEEGVQKVMATLMQCKEKWIAVKLLNRIQRCGDDRVRNRVVQMHGYQILRATLTTWKDDHNVVLQVFEILYKFPRLTRNKILDSKIEATVQPLTESEHEDVASEATRLIEEWSKLEVAYRIPRKKFDPNAQALLERRELERQDARTKSPSPTVATPTGPRGNLSHRTSGFNGPRPNRRPFHPLPSGWSTAHDQSGRIYYYSKSGQTTWHRPTTPALESPPQPKGPPKSELRQKALQDIIDSITKPNPSAQSTPKAATVVVETIPKEKEKEKKKKPSEKWRSLPIEKQKKLYENTLFPHIKHVMQKYAHKLPKEDLKKFAKEVGKILVASDFKNDRVSDPNKISEKQEKKVKGYVREYFEKAVTKKKMHEKKKAERSEKEHGSPSAQLSEAADLAVLPSASTPKNLGPNQLDGMQDESDGFPDPSDDEAGGDLDDFSVRPPSISSSPRSTPTAELKRKREGEDEDAGSETESNKRMRSDVEDMATPPPPPPPPPVEDMPDTIMGGLEAEERVLEETEEEKDLKRQEEELMRENEEALAMERDGTLKTAELARGGAYTKPTLNIKGGAMSELNGPNFDISEGDSPAEMDALKLEREREREGVLSH